MSTNLTPKQRALLAGALATMVALALVVATTPAAAQEQDESTVDRLITVSVTIASNPADFAAGVVDGIQLRIDNAVGDRPDADAEADELRSFLSQQNASVTDHANLVADERGYAVGNGTYTYAVTVDDGLSTSSFYIVATADGETIQGYDTVNNTSNTVDQRIVLTSNEAEALNEDIREYNETYIEPGRVPDDGYFVGIGAKYGTQMVVA